jgi:hypothetical protein
MKATANSFLILIIPSLILIIPSTPERDPRKEGFEKKIVGENSPAEVGT